MSKILIETRLNSLKLNESKQPRKGCLGRIEGVCADYANPTRNGRFYSKELWEKVFNDDLIKESLESKTLIGELDHPEERFEPLAKEACVVMTDYTFDDDKQVVYGGFDVLDTPAGRILKSLLDYGCVMGVSSRGQGDIISNAEYEMVDPDTYEFACFDVVTTPAVMTARQHVTESVKNQKIKGLNASIIEQVNSSKTNEELDTILRVIESTGLSNIATVKEAIENKRKSITDGKTISEKTAKDLREAKKRIAELEREIDSNSDKTIRENKELHKTASNLSSQVLAYRHREKRLIDTVESLNKQIQTQKGLLSNKRNDYAALQKENAALKKENAGLKMQTENINSKVAKLTKKYNTQSSSVDSYKEKVSRLESLLKEREDSITQLTEKLNASEKNYQELSKSTSVKLTESTKRNDKTVSQLNSFREGYIKNLSKMYGLDESFVKTIPQNLSANEIEDFAKKYLEKLDRYSLLPFSNNPSKNPTRVLNESLISADNLDAEFETSKHFIETAGEIFNN